MAHPTAPKSARRRASAAPVEPRVVDSLAGMEPVVASSVEKVHCSAQVTNSCGVPFGAVFTPCALSPGSFATVQSVPPRCSTCGAFYSSLSSIERGGSGWTCPLCSSFTPATQTPDQRLPQDIPASLVIDWVEPSGPMKPANGTQALVLLADATLDARDTAAMRRCLESAVTTLPDHCRVALVVFGACLRAAHLGASHDTPSASASGAASPALRPQQGVDGGAAQAVTAVHWDAYSGLGDDVESSGGGLALLRLHRKRHLAPLGECRATLLAALRSIRPCPSPAAVAARARCLGAAVQAGLELLGARVGGDSGPAGGRAAPGGGLLTTTALGGAGTRGRVMLMTGGASTTGPGMAPADGVDDEDDPQLWVLMAKARKFYAAAANAARRAGVCVDVVAGGSRATNMQLLAVLAQQSGGSVLVHEGFGEWLRNCCAAAASRPPAFAGYIDARVSAEARVTALTGSVLPVSEAVTAREKELMVSPAAAALPSCEPDRGWGVCFELGGDVSRPFVVVQLVASWVMPGGERLTRVCTYQVDATSSLPAFAASVNAPAAGALLGKAAAMAAVEAGWPSEDALDAGKSILKQAVASIRTRLGTEASVRRSLWGSTVDRWRLAAPLRPLLLAIYHLERGPLLGGVAGHADEFSLTHIAMLEAGLPRAVAMVSPRLYRMEHDGSFTEALPVDLALMPTAVLVLDHGTHMFSWLGRHAAAAAHRAQLEGACVEFVARLGAGRFPAPVVVASEQNAGDARYVVARLIPAHRDANEEHEEDFPPLRALRAEVRAGLLQQIPRTDQESFRQWCRSNMVEFEPAGGGGVANGGARAGM
ncbi:unnamed protein product [Pedinophyceae sp. YPF-701]|nr:unnamed protein product [Pedinophyceae sp. YPF-701]